MPRYCPSCEDPLTTNPAIADESKPAQTGIHPSGPLLVVTSEPEHCDKCGEPIQQKL